MSHHGGPTSRTLRRLFGRDTKDANGAASLNKPGSSSSSTLTGLSAHPHSAGAHPPRTSATRSALAGLSLRSPSLKPTPELDVLQDNLPDDIEFLSLDSPRYDEPGSYGNDDLDTIDENEFKLDRDDEGDLQDWPSDSALADEAVHIEGIPSSSLRLEARQYKSPAFATALLNLLRDELAVPGWAQLGPEVQTSQMSVHKVSGSLTNAVFFISYPLPETVASGEAQHMPIPPTVLLRIYGPSSGNLISRKKELHVLNVLSAVYSIGPAILGTFANGRVEEYFESRALYKEELRDPRTSRWIARRMRELHSVDIALVELPPEQLQQQHQQHLHDSQQPFSRANSIPFHGLSRKTSEYAESYGSSVGTVSSPLQRPQLASPAQRPQMPSQSSSGGANSSHGAADVGQASGPARPAMPYQSDSGQSGVSASSASSVYSYSSSYSSSSGSNPLLASPLLTARSASKPGISEGLAPKKKRSMSSVHSRSEFSLEGAKFKRPKSVVWQNIDSWTKEARKVLRRVEKLKEITSNREPDVNDVLMEEVNPLFAPSLLINCKARLNLASFDNEVRSYKKHIERWEAERGKSKRVFAHNDTQCGNLLRLTPGGKDEMVPGLRTPHEMIIVVDFEYAGVNPRAFDIANHFLEWQTDYHHPTLSHSLSRHGTFPTLEERQRFYRAYIPYDAGFDTGRELPIPALAEDDPRAQRLEEEVQLWLGSSHAMYAVWSIVQATDDIVAKIDEWLANPEAAREADRHADKLRANATATASGHTEASAEKLPARPNLERGKSGEEIQQHAPEAAPESDATKDDLHAAITQLGDFDYLSYALERVQMFRRELVKLGIKD